MGMKDIGKWNNFYGTWVVTFSDMINKMFKKDIRDKQYIPVQ